jgi:hypothetical protein
MTGTGVNGSFKSKNLHIAARSTSILQTKRDTKSEAKAKAVQAISNNGSVCFQKIRRPIALPQTPSGATIIGI